jgi:hypothetical protein
VEIPAVPIDYIGWDTETHLIKEGDIMPRMVCSTFDLLTEAMIAPGGRPYGTGTAWGCSNGDPHTLDHLLEMFQRAYTRGAHIIIQEAAFDLCVALRYCLDVQSGLQQGDKAKAAELYLLIWDVLDRSASDELMGGRPLIHDTILREKLYNLSTHGGIDAYPSSQGAKARDISYGIQHLVAAYFGVDISATKVTINAAGRVFNDQNVDITGTPAAGASWRLRYSDLDGVPFAQFPRDAAEYAIDDATWARCICWAQERKRTPRLHGSMNSESLQVYSAVGLRLFSAPGFRVDHGYVNRLQSKLAEVFERCDVTLRLNGILRSDGSRNDAVLHDRIRHAWAKMGEMPVTTGSKDKDGQLRICADSDVLERLTGVDPVIDMYADRQEFAKLRDSFLPNLQGERVYSNYDTLKETGRVSSYGNSDKSRRKPLYPAVNIQQIPRGSEEKGVLVRECFLPAYPGYIFGSSDYSALELCSVAQVTYSLFGHSVHRDKNLLGYDLHSYLGAGMASTLAPHLVDGQVTYDLAYQAFMKNRKADRKLAKDDTSPEAKAVRDLVKAIKHYRNFAKPVGLGYPGGLGAKTLVTFAKTTYGVDCTEEQATTFRTLWRSIYPEMPEFFKWLNGQVDASNHDKDGGETYWYETQGYNRMRAGAGFCAAANGKSMQSLGADGAKRSVAWVARACYGGLPPENPFSLLRGCIPSAFIHDENIVAYPDDALATERALLVSQLMVYALQITMPDVKLAAEPAFSRRWVKAAEPEWVEDRAREVEVKQLLYGMGGSAFIDGIANVLGDTWKPHMRLVPWDDIHRKAS